MRSRRAQADDLIGESGKSLWQEDFVYLAEENVYRCPASEKLTYRFTSQEQGQKLHRYGTNVCRNCALKKSLHARPAAPRHAFGARARARANAFSRQRMAPGAVVDGRRVLVLVDHLH